MINPRGIIVPIVDMRFKFFLGNDGISDVIAMSTGQIKPAPEFSVALGMEYITGPGTMDDRMIIVVVIEKLMSSGDMALMEKAVA